MAPRLLAEFRGHQHLRGIVATSIERTAGSERRLAGTHLLVDDCIGDCALIKKRRIFRWAKPSSSRICPSCLSLAGQSKELRPHKAAIFPHPPEKLWRALTESPLLAQWMMNNDFEPVVGRKFQFRAEPMPNWNGVVDCEVLIVDPLQRLSYNWGVGGGEAAGGLQWVVLWTLTPAEGGTHVRMEQSGFRPDQQAAYQGAKYGWQKFFGGLERVVGGLD